MLLLLIVKAWGLINGMEDFLPSGILKSILVIKFLLITLIRLLIRKISQHIRMKILCFLVSKAWTVALIHAIILKNTAWFIIVIIVNINSYRHSTRYNTTSFIIIVIIIFKCKLLLFHRFELFGGLLTDLIPCFTHQECSCDFEFVYVSLWLNNC